MGRTSAADDVCLRKDCSDLDALRSRLCGMLVAGQVDDALDRVLERFGQVRDANDVLQVRLQNALRQLNGRRSGKLSVEQLALFDRLLQLQDAAAASEAPSPDAPSPGAPPSSEK